MEDKHFDEERPRLVAIASRILGSDSEADDVVQEAWLRLARADLVEDPPAWLTTVVTRLCLDHLRRRGTRSVAEAAAPAPAPSADPEADALLADRVGGAMQVVLDTLAPAERAAFVLHDVFGYPFDDISAVLGRSGTAVRQLASRARRKLQGAPESTTITAARKQNTRVVEAFFVAAHGGDLAALLSLLAPDVVMAADLVGQQLGTDALYDGASAVAARFNGSKGAVPVTIDGDPGGAWIQAGEVKVVFAFHIEAGSVREIEIDRRPRRVGDHGRRPAATRTERGRSAGLRATTLI